MNLLLRAFGIKDEEPRTVPCPCCGQPRKLGWLVQDSTTVEGIRLAYIDGEIDSDEFVRRIDRLNAERVDRLIDRPYL